MLLFNVLLFLALAHPPRQAGGPSPALSCCCAHMNTAQQRACRVSPRQASRASRRRSGTAHGGQVASIPTPHHAHPHTRTQDADPRAQERACQVARLSASARAWACGPLQRAPRSRHRGCTAQHSTALHSTAQHSTAKDSTTHGGCNAFRITHYQRYDDQPYDDQR